jgi:hypothetical protein
MIPKVSTENTEYFHHINFFEGYYRIWIAPENAHIVVGYVINNDFFYDNILDTSNFYFYISRSNYLELVKNLFLFRNIESKDIFICTQLFSLDN